MFLFSSFLCFFGGGDWLEALGFLDFLDALDGLDGLDGLDFLDFFLPLVR